MKRTRIEEWFYILKRRVRVPDRPPVGVSSRWLTAHGKRDAVNALDRLLHIAILTIKASFCTAFKMLPHNNIIMPSMLCSVNGRAAERHLIFMTPRLEMSNVASMCPHEDTLCWRLQLRNNELPALPCVLRHNKLSEHM